MNFIFRTGANAMRLMILEGPDVANIFKQFNDLVESGSVNDPVEYGITREILPDGTTNRIFTLFYK